MTYRRVVVIAGLVITAVSVGFGWYVWDVTWPTGTRKLEWFGQLGDSFGLLNAAFSGLALVGILVTLHLQRKELSEAREIAQRQRFEGSFFRLLDFYQHNLNEIRVTDNNSGTRFEGLNALNFLLKRLNGVLAPYSKYFNNEATRPLFEMNLYQETQWTLTPQGRYLGTLESLLDLIEREIHEPQIRIHYQNIVASQLTVAEVRYIFYRCLVGEKGYKLRDLVHRAFLSTSHSLTLCIPASHKNVYEKIHGVTIPYSKPKPVLPQSRSKFKKLKARLKKQGLYP